MWNRQFLILDAQLAKPNTAGHIAFALTSYFSWVTTSAFPTNYGAGAPQPNKVRQQVSDHKPLFHKHPIWLRHMTEEKSVLKYLGEHKIPGPF